MARIDPQRGELTLRFVVTGPTLSGKSEVMARLRERLAAAGKVVAREVRSTAFAIKETRLALVLELVEIDPVEAERPRAEAAFAEADGVLYVADPGRERLRDHLIASAWLLERLRAAACAELPGVVLLSKRTGVEEMAGAEIESIVGGGRFPSFAADALRGDEVARGFLELARRAVTRLHARVPRDAALPELPSLLLLLDEILTRPSCAPPAAVVEPPVEPAAAVDGRRHPLARACRSLASARSAQRREARRVAERVAQIEAEALRPLTFLRSLFAHLEREGPRLSTELHEAVAGGREVVAHLEALVAATTQATTAPPRPAAAPAIHLPALARAAFDAVAADHRGAPLRLELRGLEGGGLWRGDAGLVSALLWSAVAAQVASRGGIDPSRRRAAAPIVVRIGATARGRVAQLRVGRLGALRRGRGAEELVLVRQLARQVGWRLVVVPRRAGGSDLRLEMRAPLRRAEPVDAIAPEPVTAASASPSSGAGRPSVRRR